MNKDTGASLIVVAIAFGGAFLASTSDPGVALSEDVHEDIDRLVEIAQDRGIVGSAVDLAVLQDFWADPEVQEIVSDYIGVSPVMARERCLFCPDNSEMIWLVPLPDGLLTAEAWFEPLPPGYWDGFIGPPLPPSEEDYFEHGPGSIEPVPIVWSEDLDHGHVILRRVSMEGVVWEDGD